MNYNISELISEAASSNIKKITSNSSAFSFCIVNVEGNSKRITVSKALAEKLEIDDNMQIVPLETRGILLVGKELPVKNASECSLRGKDKKISYNAPVVKYLTEMFNLDFSNRTSMSFSEITFDDYEGFTIAVIKMSDILDEDTSDA